MKTFFLCCFIVLATFFVPRMDGAKVWPIEAHCTGQPSVIMIPVPIPQKGQGA